MPTFGHAMGDATQVFGAVFVLDRAAHIHAGGTGRDDGITAFEQQPGRDRHGLARFGIARDLHFQNLPLPDAFGLPQEQPAFGPVQKDTALPFGRAQCLGGKDRARRGRVRSDQQILKPAIHDQRRRFAVADMVEADQTPLHARHTG